VCEPKMRTQHWKRVTTFLFDIENVLRKRKSKPSNVFYYLRVKSILLSQS